MKILGIGDNVCDKYDHQKIMYPGGQSLNVAVYAKKLGEEAGYIGVFGSDEVAEHIVATLNKLKVDISHCRYEEGTNGYAMVTHEDGDRVFLGSNRGGVLRVHPLRFSGEDLDYIKGFDLIHTSNNSFLDDQLPLLKTAGVPISYDFSGQWNQEKKLAAVLPYIDFAFFSGGDAPEEELKSVCVRMTDSGVRMAVATMGGKGAMLWDGKEFYFQAPDYVDPVDTLGAGDSFAAAFMIELLRGHNASPDHIRFALKKAAAFSAKTCLVYGAFGEGKPYKRLIS
jgi:sugar/nucleoside kinase (ribokinase family)